jgi:hypothetical protein
MYSDERDTMVALAILAVIIGFLLAFFGLRAAFGDVVADFSCAAGLFAAAIAIALEVRK